MSDDEMDINNFIADDEPINPRAHKNLLQAISSLGKAQHIKRATRNESEKQPDEFQLIKDAFASSKQVTAEPAHPVVINDIVQILKGTGKHLKVGKNLKNVATTTKVVPVPLEKPAAERIKRTIGYDKVKKNLARWDAVVTKNRTSETQVFPLQTETVYIDTSAHAKPLKLAIKSDLALEMEATEAKLAALRKERSGDTRDPKALAAEEQRLLATKLTRDELLARRKELAYLKMRESQKSAKARMQNKIKSKKYHKLMKRQKMQQQIKDFELLQKTNPEAALEKLNLLERNRVLERANLRHKNTGTWAKNLQIRARFDKDVRKDLSEQLQISRQLTQKKYDSEEEVEEEAQKIADDDKAIAARIEIDSKDSFNPWTRASKSDDNRAAKETLDGENYRKYWLERNDSKKLLAEYKQLLVEENKAEDVTKADEKSIIKLKSKQQVKKQKKAKKQKKPVVENGWLVEEIEDSKTKLDTINIDDIFDAEEDRQQGRLNKKLKILAKESKRLRKVHNNKKKPIGKANALKQLSDLSFKETAKRPIIDEALNGDNADEQESEENAKRLQNMLDSNTNSGTAPSNATASDVIDPTQIAPIKLKQYVNSLEPLEAADYDADEAETDGHLSQQQMFISEAFVDDDIVADFSKDKSDKSKLSDAEIQLSLPGWGSWAGAGISERAAARQNKRLVLILAPEEKRRDENKGGVFINEETGKGLRTHLVSDIPFPFTSLQDYEASIRAPVGRNFVPETAFRMLTRPQVITRKGAIIEPMEESELLKQPGRGRNVVEKRILNMSKK